MSLMNGKQYIESLRKLNTKVYLFGKRVDNFVDHPMIRPSINSVAMTYELACDPEYQNLCTAVSGLTGKKINRFCHLHQSQEDLMKKVKMQRLLGQKQDPVFSGVLAWMHLMRFIRQPLKLMKSMVLHIIRILWII